MFMYSMLQFYAQQTEHYDTLNSELRCLKPHRVVSRHKNGKNYYFETIEISGRKTEKSISEDEFYALSLENYRYNTVRSEMAECRNFLDCFEKRAKSYGENLQKRYDLLCKMPLMPHNESAFYPEHMVYQTARGELVRSKSEQAIADGLFNAHADYVYESADAVEGLRPDFFVRDNVRGMPVIWEHLGRLDHLNYLADFMRKLDVYAKNGYYPGVNLIITYELYDPARNVVLYPFDSAKVQRVIKEWFLPR